MIFIKRLTLILAVALIIGIFPGCAGKAGGDPVEPDALAEAGVFAAYRESDGFVVKLGDKEEDIARLLGPDEHFIVEFEEGNTTRVDYYGNEEIHFDYNSDGIVWAVRFESYEWKIYNGLKVDDTSFQVREQYEKNIVRESEQSDTLMVSYDKGGNPIEFSASSPYIVMFNMENSRVKRIIIQKSTPDMTE